MLRGAFRAAPVSSNSSNGSGNRTRPADNSDDVELGPPFTQRPPNDNMDNDIVSNSSSSLSYRSYSLGTDYTPRTKRKIKHYAATVSQSLNIPISLMTSFTELPSPVHMLIDLKASLVRIEQLHGTSKAIDKLQAKEFKSSLNERLWVILISPNLTAYRTGLIEHIMSKIHENPAVFGLDQELIDDLDAINKLKKMVGSLLTKMRGTMKQKLTKSICTGINVVRLTRKLAPPTGLVFTAAHWNRVAFLRACLMEHEKISPPRPANEPQDDTNATGDDGAPINNDDIERSSHNGADGDRNGEDEDGSEDGSDDSSDHLDASNQYWIFVDKQLKKFRTEAGKRATPEQPAEEVLRCAFNQICTTDIKTFKSLKGGETLTFDSYCPSPWQKEMEDASIW